MAHKKRTLTLIGMCLSLLWSAACTPTIPASTPTTPAPAAATLDLNPLRTEIAGTVFAQVTQALALTPSITPLATLTSTFTPTLTASPAPSAAVTLATGTPQATAVNLDQWVAQSVADDTSFAPGQSFTMTWTIKNTGSSTWTIAYLLRFYGGSAFGAPTEIPLSRAVAPGDQIDISIQMKAPTKTGTYDSTWVMANPNRFNFKQPVYLRIKVALPGTPSPTPNAYTAEESKPRNTKKSRKLYRSRGSVTIFDEFLNK